MDPHFRRNYRFNFTVGVVNAVFFMFGIAFMSPTTVLPNFVNQLTDSKFLIGLASALHIGCWALPQVVTSGWVERYRSKKSIYLIANAVRMTLVGLAFLSVFLLVGSRPGLALASFMVLYGGSMVFGGLGGLALTELFGTLIPSHRRAAFFSFRFLFGGSILTILAGVLVTEILDRPGDFPFPRNYEILFGTGWFLMLVGCLLMFLIRENPPEQVPERKPLLSGLFQAPTYLRADEGFRTLIVARLLGMASRMSWPFFIILAREDLGLKESVVGTFLIVQTVGALVGNLFWGSVSTRLGNRVIIRVCSAAEVLAPLYAALVGLWLRYYGTDLAPEGVAFALAPTFFFMGMTWHGSFTGVISYVLDMAPEDRRPTYMGIVNTVIGVATLTMLLGGVIADCLGLMGVFVLSTVCAAAGLAKSFQLREHRR